MGKLNWLLGIALLVAVNSCGSALTGEFPFPVRTMQIVSSSLPPATVGASDTLTLDVAWSGGADTFTVTWTFGGGTTEEVIQTSGPQRESSVDVTFTLENDESGLFSALVQIVDDRGNIVEKPFSYFVEE